MTLRSTSIFGNATRSLIAAYLAASEASDDLPEIIRMDGHTFRAMGGKIPDEWLNKMLDLSGGEITVVE